MDPFDPAEQLKTLEQRFVKNPKRHPDLAWSVVQAKLEVTPAKLKNLWEMERTGGEPDVVGNQSATGCLSTTTAPTRTMAPRGSGVW